MGGPEPLRRCRERLGEALALLEERGLGCRLGCEELLSYLQGPGYEDDTIGVEEILDNDLLLLHEAAEACILRRMGHQLGPRTVVEAYPDTYRAHLEAMDVELGEAERRGEESHVERRCRDLASYLDDPHLPEELRDMVHGLLSRHCRGIDE